MKPDLLSIAFTLIYTFAFREATKRAAEWGAFQFHNGELLLKKIGCASFPILVFLPLLFYWLSLKVISKLIISTDDLLSFLVDLLWMIPLIALLGFFPRTAKNLWNLVAQCKVCKGRSPGQPGDGWLLDTIKPGRDLPRWTYSRQVVVWLGIVQVGLLVFMLFYMQMSFDDLFVREDVSRLFVMIYVSEMIVLHHRAKSLNYFYPEPRPNNLLACRTIPSVFVSVLLPIIFAILCSPWVLWLQEEAHGCCFWVGVGLSLLGLFFPIYCNNLLLLVAKKRKWIDPSSLELKGPAWYWILGVVSIAAFLFVTLPNGDLYIAQSKKVFNWLKPSIKLNEGNVPPDREPLPPVLVKEMF